MKQRLEQQLTFLREIDKLKHIQRQTLLLDASRRENDAEHSWHLAMAVLLLQEYGNSTDYDLLKVLQMVLIHDIVEVDAGDTYAYDEAANVGKYEREQKAAKRLYGLLPEDQRVFYKALWEEFEAAQTKEAKLANALDRFMPLYHNYTTGGKQWKLHNVSKEQVLTRNQPIQDGSEALWEKVLVIVEDAVTKGMLH
jgi:putative hydrolase of HD superfamily